MKKLSIVIILALATTLAAQAKKIPGRIIYPDRVEEVTFQVLLTGGNAHGPYDSGTPRSMLPFLEPKDPRRHGVRYGSLTAVKYIDANNQKHELNAFETTATEVQLDLPEKTWRLVLIPALGSFITLVVEGGVSLYVYEEAMQTDGIAFDAESSIDEEGNATQWQPTYVLQALGGNPVALEGEWGYIKAENRQGYLVPKKEKHRHTLPNQLKEVFAACPNLANQISAATPTMFDDLEALVARYNKGCNQQEAYAGQLITASGTQPVQFLSSVYTMHHKVEYVNAQGDTLSTSPAEIVGFSLEMEGETNTWEVLTPADSGTPYFARLEKKGGVNLYIYYPEWPVGAKGSGGQYYVLKKGEGAPVMLPNKLNKRRRVMEVYFEACPSLITYINRDPMNLLKQMHSLVEIYNSSECAKN